VNKKEEKKERNVRSPSRQSGQSPISLLSGSRPCSFLVLCERRDLMAATIYNLLRRKATHVHREAQQHQQPRPTVLAAAGPHNDFVHLFVLLYY
jgi:hypothetical protein